MNIKELRLNTSLGYLRLVTGIPVGKPMSMSTCGSESPGGWNPHRSKLGFQNTKYSCQVPVSTCAVPYWFFFATFWFLFTQDLFFVLNYYIKLKLYIKIIRGGDEVEVMAGRGVKHSRQCCKYGWGGRHACAHAIICLCPYLPLFVCARAQHSLHWILW